MWILISLLFQKLADLDLRCLQEKPADLDLRCLQEKPADLDLRCLQELIYIYIWFHTIFERINCLSKLISSYRQVKFSMDKYILAFYLSLDK